MHGRFLRLLVPALVVGSLVLYGCSDDKATDDNNVVITDNQLDSAFAVLMQRSGMMVDSLMGSGDFSMSDYDYRGLHAIFTGYLAEHPGHSKASFGASMTSMLVMTSNDQIAGLFDSLWGEAGGLLGARVRFPAKLTDQRNVCLLPADVPSIGIERDFLAKSYLAIVARATSMPTQFSQIQGGIRQYGLPAVNGSLTNLNTILADSDYVCWVTPEMMDDTTMTDSVEIDRTDFLAFAAGITVVKSFLHLAVAYNVDISGWDSAGIAEILDQHGDWMTLYADGASQMTTARTAFLNAVDLADECLTSLEAEYVSDSDQTDDLLGGLLFGSLLTADHIAGYRGYLDLANAYLTEPQWIHGDFNDDGIDTDSLRISVRRIFEDPIEVPASYVPPYTFTINSVWDTAWLDYPTNTIVDSVDSFYQVAFTWDADTVADFHFPDPSFNGILVDITTDSALQAVFDDPEEDWSKYDTLEVPMAPTILDLLNWYNDQGLSK
jgi:hypothetical protein